MPNDITEGKAAHHVKHSESVEDANKFSTTTWKPEQCLATFPERGARCDRRRGHEGNHSDEAKSFAWIPEVGSMVGDDKSLASCRGKFSNALNFGGTPEPRRFIEDEGGSLGTVVVIGDCRKQDFLVIHELGLVLADLGKLGDDGLCYCEAAMPVEPSLPHEHKRGSFNALLPSAQMFRCVYCHEDSNHDIHKRPFQRKHSDKCLRARKALDEFGEWLKTEKAGKAAPVAPEGVNAQEKAVEKTCASCKYYDPIFDASGQCRLAEEDANPDALAHAVSDDAFHTGATLEVKPTFSCIQYVRHITENAAV